MDIRYKKVLEKNLDYFTQTLKESENEHAAVAQSEISHIKRFDKMLELGDFTNSTILDIGCGIGGFYDFLKAKWITCNYTGFDINPNMIKKAKEDHPKIADHFFVFDILEKQLERTFDFVVSVGPLNLTFDHGLNLHVTIQLIKQMFLLSNIGCAISMTSSMTKKPTEGTFYYNPSSVLSEVSSFCQNVRVDHTYLPHDFTIFCYKQSLYTD